RPAGQGARAGDGRVVQPGGRVDQAGGGAFEINGERERIGRHGLDRTIALLGFVFATGALPWWSHTRRIGQVEGGGTTCSDSVPLSRERSADAKPAKALSTFTTRDLMTFINASPARDAGLGALGFD